MHHYETIAYASLNNIMKQYMHHYETIEYASL